MRRSSRIAALRTKQITQNNASDTSQPSQSIDKGMILAAKRGYDSTIHIVRFLLDEIHSAKFENQRYDILGKMIEILNKNPSILIFLPNFRNVLISKISEAEEHIRLRFAGLQSEMEHATIQMIILTTEINLRNPIIRQKISEDLCKFNKALKEYEELESLSSELTVKINNLKMTLETIKNDPSYVTE